MNDILDEIRYQYYNRTMLKSKICLMVGAISLAIYCFNRSDRSFHIAILALAILIVLPIYFSTVEKRIRNNDIYDIARRICKINDDRDQRYKILITVLNTYELDKLKALHLKLKSGQGKSLIDSLNGSIGTFLAGMALLVSLIPDNAKQEDFYDFKVFILFCLFVVGVIYLIVVFLHDNPDEYILHCIEEVLENN
ncbi:hypothetical protein ACOAOT_23120 [Lacrimispora sp. AGF001]|uniref:hypothetical protein n=1 Tax=Lacrimispora sp. AGF001 TaxID=3401631 RepID=UPI003B432C41